MKRVSRSIRLVWFFAFVWLEPSIWSQASSPTVSFSVYTDPPGAKFAVDGIIYTSAATFQWPAGSKHLVRYVQDSIPGLSLGGSNTGPTLAPVQLSPDGNTVYSFSNWADSTGLLAAGSDPNQIVTADPSVTFLKASVTLNYRVLLNFFDSPPATLPSTCGSPGVLPPDGFRVGLVYVGGQCYWNNAILYLPANQKLTLNAFPYPGFVFLGWSSNLGSNNAYLQTYTLAGPLTLAPRFSPAKRVRFETAPLGLQVLVDRTPTPTLSSDDPNAPCPHNEGLPITVPSSVQALCRGDFDFAPGSNHLVGALTPQIDQQGKNWVFGSWGSGQGQNDVYTADLQTAVPGKVVVNFVPAAQASFVTVPSGLKLSVDGRSNWPAYNFVWGMGSIHQVSAPAQQTDASGRKFTFRAWSNGGGAAQSVTVDQSAVDSGFRIIAQYDSLSRVVVQTSPPGQKLQVDGADCLTPCNVDRSSGSSIHVTAPTTIPLSDGVRLDLSSWSDGGAADHNYTVNSDFQTVTANFTTSYRLMASSDPANGANLRLDPSSPDMYYPADTQLSATAEAKPGFKFRRWAGDLSGTYPAGTLAMSAPRSLTALLDRIPYIGPAGVSNAAGVTPSPAVAAGSLIAINGESLASDTVQGRVNPLAQTLDGVTVTVGDRLLPLVSVSPETVIAQLPSDLPAGDYTLQVHSQGQPDVSGAFSVADTAPGLFSTPQHQDGTPVTADSPAANGETITVFGTGFGPYSAPVIDGFFPFDPAPAITGAADVMLADQIQPQTWCGAASGYTGMAAIKLQITGALPSGSNVEMKVRINGVMSNTVLIPIQ